MLRQRSPEGWVLIRHPDHALLAGEFAAAWGNDRFRIPQPRADVVEGVARHDDGWSVRDQTPRITRQGRPSAFGADLVGAYTAFEEIDLADYLAVRGRAMEVVAEGNPYAAILISMHTCNLLTEHADRSTIQPANLPLLDAFVASQRARQVELRGALLAGGRPAEELSGQTLLENFRLLQACDNMSLLSCVDYAGPATLLHPLPLVDGGVAEVQVRRVGPRTFQLTPWPFNQPRIERTISGRPVTGETFRSDAELQSAYGSAPVSTVDVILVA